MSLTCGRERRIVGRQGYRRARRTGVAVLLLLGCGESPTGFGSAPRISIEPAGPVTLYRGDTLTVEAVIRNSRHTEVLYSSSAPGVVSVDPLTGHLRALTEGAATITAASAIDPRIFAELSVATLADLPASITLLSVRDGGAEEADRVALAGAISIQLRLERGNGRRLEVALGDSVICRADYPSPGAEPPPEAEVSCGVDTAGFDAASGSAHFLNGELPLTVRLFASGDRLLADLPPVTLTLANAPLLVTRTTPGRKAIDADGRAWIGGDVIVEVQPVLYEPGESVDGISIRYRSPDGRDTVAVDVQAPFSATLLGGGALAGVTDSLFRVELSSTDQAGEAGPGGWTEPQRYDSEPPRPGMVLPREWVGAQTRFASSYNAEGEWDAGVGMTAQRFHAGDPALDSVAVVAQGKLVTVGADLAQAAARSYRLAVQVCDALQNCTIRDGFVFGVDLTPPLIESVGIADRSVNPATDLAIGVRDDLSGFPGRFIETSVTRVGITPIAAACGPLVEGIDLPGRVATGGCLPDTLGNPVPVPRSTPGYYGYSLVAFDRAGNRSLPLTRTLLVDLQPPALQPFTLPAALVPGEEAVIEASGTDDVELASIDFRLLYPEGNAGSIAIPYSPPLAVGTAFDEILTREATVSGRVPFVRTLTYAGGSVVARRTVLVDSVRVIARDVADHATASTRYVPRGAFGSDSSTTDPFPRFTAAVATVDRTAVCTAGCGGGDPTSVRISVRIEGESGTGRPFAKLHLYRRAASGRLTHLGSVPGGDATITNSGTSSTFVYLFDHTPTAGLTGEFTIVAVGVTSRGNGLITELAAPAAPAISFYRR